MMASSNYQPQLILAKEAAKVAGNIILSYHSTSVGRCNNSAKVNVKSGVDLVTEADTRVEKIVTEMIKKAFPSDLIVGEEDQAESPKGKHGDDFPAGSVWCVGMLEVIHALFICRNLSYKILCTFLLHFVVLLCRSN